MEGSNENWKLLGLTWKRYRGRKGESSVEEKRESRNSLFFRRLLSARFASFSILPTPPVSCLLLPCASLSASLSFCRCSKNIRMLLELSQNAFPQLPRFVPLPLLQLLRRFVSLHCTRYAHFCSISSLVFLQGIPSESAHYQFSSLYSSSLPHSFRQTRDWHIRIQQSW